MHKEYKIVCDRIVKETLRNGGTETVKIAVIPQATDEQGNITTARKGEGIYGTMEEAEKELARYKKECPLYDKFHNKDYGTERGERYGDKRIEQTNIRIVSRTVSDWE